MGKAKHLGKGAILLGTIIAKVVWDQVKDTQFVKDKREKFNEWTDGQQQKLEAKLQELEDRFWEWVKQIDAQANEKMRIHTDSSMSLTKACRILEIPTHTDLETAKSAWKQKMRACHPDLFSNAPDLEKAKAHEEAQRVNAAFQFLKKYHQAT